MAYKDSWWSKSGWWNPLAALSNGAYDIYNAVVNQDAGYLTGSNPNAASKTVLNWLSNSAAGTGDLSGAGIGAGLNNLVTGNLDYQRQQDILNQEMAFNSAQADIAHQRSLDLAANSAALERELRQSQYQDTVAGMRAAGLNPALMYGGGSAQLVSSAPPSGGSGSRASVGSRTAVHAGAAVPMIAGALISAGAMLANSALTGKVVLGAAAKRKIGF